MLPIVFSIHPAPSRDPRQTAVQEEEGDGRTDGRTDGQTRPLGRSTRRCGHQGPTPAAWAGECQRATGTVGQNKTLCGKTMSFCFGI